MKKHIVGLLVLSITIIPSFVFAQADVDPNGSASACVSLQNNLRYRSRDVGTNGEVSVLQDFLQSQSLLNSEPTGFLGLMTVASVKVFQTNNGISPTGYVGPVTRARISSLTCAGGTTTGGTTTGSTTTTTTTTYQPEILITGFTSALGGPNAAVRSGDVVSIFGANFTSNANILVDNIGEGYYGILNYISPSQVSFVTPTSLSLGTHNIKIAVPRTDGRGGNVSNGVNINVIATTTPVASTCSTGGYDTRTGFRCGCTAAGGGFSSVTGEACGGTTTISTPSITFTTNKTSTTAGESVTLRLAALNSNFCSLQANAEPQNWQSSNPFTGGANYSATFYPTINTTYAATCYNSSLGGENGPYAQQFVRVVVSPAATSTNYCSTTGYDTRTGLRCGCTAAGGFSSVTGESCGNTTVEFKIIGPKAGDTLNAGETYTAAWQGRGGQEVASYQVYLMHNGGVVELLGTAYETEKDVDAFTYTIQRLMPAGIYYLKFEARAASAQSDAFNIASTISNNTLYIGGCSSTSGFSSTTGEPCGNTTSSTTPAPNNRVLVTIPTAQSSIDYTGLVAYSVNRGQTYQIHYSGPQNNLAVGYYVWTTRGQFIGKTYPDDGGNINWTVPFDLSATSPTFIQFHTTNDPGDNGGTNIAGQTGKIWPNEQASTTTSSTIDLKVNGSDGPVTVSANSLATVTWQTTSATNCYVQLGDTTESVASSGSETMPIGTNGGTLSLYCTFPGGRANDTVVINVTPQNPYTDVNYSQISSTSLSSAERTVTYTYPNDACGSLMTQYSTAGSVYVGNGPVYTAAVQNICSSPNTSSFRTYSCHNGSSSNGTIQGTATFAFTCNQ